MVEPVSITCGILYAGLGKLLWEGAVAGVVGNRSDAVVLGIGKALHGRLLGRRGLSENHDIAKALRLAQLTATGFVIEAYARKTDSNSPVAFLAGVRHGLKRAKKQVESLAWDADVEAAMFASYQQAFRPPRDTDDPASDIKRLAEQTTDAAWAEVMDWAGGAHAPEILKARFYGQMPFIVGFHDAWCAEVAEAMKTDPRFKDIFVADKLVEIGDLVLSGQDVLARIDASTQGAREQITDLQAWLSGQFAGQHQRHDQTQETLRRIEEMVAAQGRALDPQAREAVIDTLEEVADSTGDDMAGAREGLADQDPIALIDGLEAAAVSDALVRLRQAASIAYAIDVTRALRIYGRIAALNPADVWTHIYLSRLHRAVGDLPAARASADAALAAATDPRDRAAVLDALGDIARAEGDLPAAKNAYQDSLDIRQDLANRDPKNTEWLRDLSVSHERLGDVARAEGDLPAARHAYQDSLEIAQDLAKRDPKNTQWLRDLSISQNKLGDIARTEGDLPAARHAYQASLDIRQDLAKRDPKNTEWLRDLSISQNKLGDVARAEGDLPAARHAYQDSLEIRQDLAKRDPKNTEWLRDLSISHERLGDVARAEGDLPAARHAYQDSLEIAQDLAKRDPKNTQWLRDLSISHDRLGDIARTEGDLPAAKDAYQAGLEIRQDLAKRDPKNTEWLRDLSISHDRLGDITTAEGDLPAAKDAYQASLDIAKDLAKRDPKNTEWLRDLAVSEAKLAQLAEAAGDLAAARAGFLEAERRFREILAISPGHAETRRMAEAAAAGAARLSD